MRVRTLLLILLLLGIVPPGPAAGQAGPDLNDLVVDWATGRYASPVMCEIDGELVRGVRRVILRPHHTLGRPTRLAVHFIDMKPGEATRCIDSTGAPQPNVQGKLLLAVPGIPHPETATRDFKRALQRDKGFSLEVTEGVLKLQDVAVPSPSPRLVDYRGGEASLRLVLPATDAARELAPFPSPRKLVLIVVSEGGPPLELPLFLASDDPI
jgi:hypothetical protein